MNARRKTKDDDPAFTAEVDRQIIEGFLKDRESMIKEFVDSGFSRAEVIRRVEVLGLTSEFYSLGQRENATPAARRCLRCSEYFASQGPQNRICARCRVKS